MISPSQTAPAAPRSPASPVSADQEGPADALPAVREAADALDAVQTCGIECFVSGGTAPQPGCQCNTCLSLGEARDAEKAIRAAISFEEARRARPAAEDPRDALLKRCATALVRQRGLNCSTRCGEHHEGTCEDALAVLDEMAANGIVEANVPEEDR